MISTAPLRRARPRADARVGIGKAGLEPLPLGRLAGSPFVRTFGDAGALLRALERGVVAGAVRGTLPSARVARALALEHPRSALQRGVLLEPKPGTGVVLGPVGITEGRGAARRAAFARGAARLLESAGLLSEPPLIAVLAVGRGEDAARGPAIARSVEESKSVALRLRRWGYDAFFAGVQIEDVLASADVVVAPDGASGNLAFRTLHLVAGMRSFGALTMGVRAPFIDTSRARASFEDPVRLAAYLALRPPRP